MVSFIRTKDGDRLFAVSHIIRIANEASPRLRGRWEVAFYSTEPHRDERHVMFDGTKDEAQSFFEALIDQIGANRPVIDPAVIRADAAKAW